MNSANDGDAIRQTLSDWSNGTRATEAGCRGPAYSTCSVYWNTAGNASGLERQMEGLVSTVTHLDGKVPFFGHA
jgi:hypothetical protein